MEKRIGPWINKKIVEYIGEEEETLTEFICNKVLLDIFSHCFCSLCVLFCQLSTHIPAQTILEELAMVSQMLKSVCVRVWFNMLLVD